MEETNESLFLKFLGPSWTYVDSNGVVQTISWSEKFRRFGEKKQSYIERHLDPETSVKLANLIKQGATDETLMEFVGAGIASLHIAFRTLKAQGLLPQQMRNRWAKRKRRGTTERLAVPARSR